MKQSGKLDSMLSRWSVWTANNRKKALLITAIITVVMITGIVLFLNMEMTFYSMLPKSSQNAKDLERITEEFPFASSIFIVVEGDKPENIKSAVDAISAELEKETYSSEIEQVRGSIDIEAFSKQMLYLSAGQTEGFSLTEQDPLSILTNLNQSLKTKTSNINELSSAEKDKLTRQLTSLNTLLAAVYDDQGSADAAVAELIFSFMLPDRYFINADQDMALIFVLPTFTMNDMLSLKPSIEKIEHSAVEIGNKFNVSVGLTGFVVVGKDEAVTAEKGLVVSTAMALGLIILLLIINFRMKSVPLMAGTPLLIGIIWTVGISAFFLGRLNLMTAMYMIALLGLGIDFAIHYLTAYIQERENGANFITAIAEGMKKSGRGIVMGAITTAVAFFALIFAKSDLIKELAIVAGTGILCELLAMFMILPALLSYRNSRLEKKGKTESFQIKKFSLRIPKVFQKAITKTPIVVFILFFAIGGVLGFFSKDVDVESNLMNMEAKGLKSVELQDRMVEKFGFSPDGMQIISSSMEETRNLTKKLKSLDLITEVDSAAMYLPSLKDQKKLKQDLMLMLQGEVAPAVFYTPEMLLQVQKDTAGMITNLQILAENINLPGKKVLSAQLNKLSSDPTAFIKIEKIMSEGMVQFISDQLKSDFITEDTLAPNLKQMYFDKSGKFNLITIIPKQNLWIQENRDALYAQLLPITDKATGMVMVADQMTQLAKTDGLRAAIAALIAIFVILLIDFKNLKMTLLTIFPLVVSIAALLGTMALLGIKFDFINIIAIPLLIGIGIDDAIHLSHRYLIEGPGSMDLVVSRIGRAIIMTTLTTMIGFASFIPSIMRAMRSTGVVLTIAMIFAFIFSIFMHSSLLLIVKEKLKCNFSPWRSRRK